MFDRRSRYYELENLHYDGDGQRPIVFKSRRFLSRDETRPVLWEVEVNDYDRPDLLAARTIQRAELFWRICDANGVMDPFELTERSRRKIRVLMPGV